MQSTSGPARTIEVQEIAALHAWAPRLGADEQRPLHVLKRLLRVNGDRDLQNAHELWPLSKGSSGWCTRRSSCTVS